MTWAHLVGSMLWDARLGLRHARRHPALTAAITIPIALAIAITTALFSVADGLLFRPLPLAMPDRLVAISVPDVDGLPAPLFWQPSRAADREALAARLAASLLFSATTHTGNGVHLGDAYLTRELNLSISGVSVGFFETVGVLPVLGRPFTSADQEVAEAFGARTTPTVPVPVVIGHELWRRFFAGNPAIIGETVTFHDHLRPVIVAGVMPPGQHFPGDTNVWTPQTTTRLFPPRLGRLAVGVSIQQVRTAFPELRLEPLREVVRPGETRAVAFLLGAAVVLLLLSWVQVASLLLATAVGRTSEMGVRLALGASRASLVREFIVYSALLNGTALLLAWLMVPGLTTLIVELLPDSLTSGQYLDPSRRAFAFASAAAVLGVLLLALLPIAVFRRVSPRRLFDGALGELPLSAARTRHVLLVAQIALTVTLVYAAGLTANSYGRTLAFDHGFDTRNLLLVRVGRGMRVDVEDDHALMRASRDAIVSLPGVVSASIVPSAPFGDSITFGRGTFGTEQPLMNDILEVNGSPIPPLPVRVQRVDPHFILTLGATLARGQSFGDSDYHGTPDTAVVNETLARQLAPLGEAIGATIRTRYFRGMIIGVLGDMSQTGPAGTPEPQLFTPAAPDAHLGSVMLVRTAVPVEHVRGAVLATLEQYWGPLPDTRVRSMADDLADVLVPWRSRALLMNVLAVLCLPLAVVGISGALMYTVRSRTREIGIRLALGADAGMIRRQVMRQAMWLVGLGLTIGATLGIMGARVMASLLFEVQGLDALTLAATIVGLLAVAWASALVPAARAAKTRPEVVLRRG